MEKGFRNAYNDFVRKVHNGILTQDDLFSVKPQGKPFKLQWEAFKSFSVWGFYLMLIVLILVAHSYVLN
jgi:uncharacterized membrane protein